MQMESPNDVWPHTVRYVRGDEECKAVMTAMAGDKEKKTEMIIVILPTKNSQLYCEFL